MQKLVTVDFHATLQPFKPTTSAGYKYLVHRAQTLLIQTCDTTSVQMNLHERLEMGRWMLRGKGRSRYGHTNGPLIQELLAFEEEVRWLENENRKRMLNNAPPWSSDSSEMTEDDGEDVTARRQKATKRQQHDGETTEDDEEDVTARRQKATKRQKTTTNRTAEGGDILSDGETTEDDRPSDDKDQTS